MAINEMDERGSNIQQLCVRFYFAKCLHERSGATCQIRLRMVLHFNMLNTMRKIKGRNILTYQYSLGWRNLESNNAKKDLGMTVEINNKWV